MQRVKKAKYVLSVGQNYNGHALNVRKGFLSDNIY